MPRGTIKKIVEEKGFGFISHNGQKDIFFHATGLADREQFDTLQVGQSVDFDVAQTDKGPRAENVRLA